MKVSTLVEMSNALAANIKAFGKGTEETNDAMTYFTETVDMQMSVKDHQQLILNLIGALSLRDQRACEKVEETLMMHRVKLAVIALRTSHED